MFILTSGTIACTNSSNQPPRISKLRVANQNVYPTGTSEIQCIVSDPEGDTMNFKWSSDSGTITGVGPIVTWKAPNEYGDFHIMVIVDDGHGNNSSATASIKVVYNENQQQGCPSCPKK